jgi:microsomal dipeptidase-like Zn-dependent dipeptidase
VPDPDPFEPGKKPEFDRFAEHFVYIADLVGADHVAIGSDVYEAYTEISWSTVTERCV